MVLSFFRTALIAPCASSRVEKKRLERSPDYSREELVAELGAAYLCAEAGISNATIDNSASYLAGWLKVLRADRRAVVLAAGAATKAAALISGGLG